MDCKTAQPDVNTNVRLVNPFTNSCLLSGPGRGDCYHLLGLPSKEVYPETIDHYGRPLGWCQICWQQELIQRKETQLTALTAEVAELQNQLKAERLSYKSLSEHVEVHEGELKEEVEELRGLVREMGNILQEVYLTPTWDARGECCYCGRKSGHDNDCERKQAGEITSRSKVKKIILEIGK